MKKTIVSFLSLALLTLLLNLQLSTCFAQGTAFSYQGQLQNNGQPVNGTYDFSFILYTTNLTGVPIAGPVTNTAVAVSNGLFATTIDFGNAFTGQSNWLEIAVSTNGANAFTTLAPRQQLNPVPYAITAANVSGMVPLSALPSAVVTNGASGVNVSGTFTGDGSGITNVAGTLSQVVASGASLTAQPNTAYDLTNSSLVSVSLPTNANVGDIVQVDDTGSGGWQVLGPQPWMESTSSGTTNQEWESIASSANGSNLVAVAKRRGIWTSSDSGVTWTESTSIGTTNQQWSSVASSASGSNLVAVASEGGIWTSSDSGVTWIESTSIGTTNQAWESIASSASGSNLVAAANGIWTSINSGVTWIESTSAGILGQEWQSVASSASGSNLVAATVDGGIWTSINSGVTWKQSTSTSILGQEWQSVASSASGSNLVAVVNEGGIWTSTNGGVAWTESTSTGTLDQVWRSVASSASGSNLVAVANGGGIWTSTDGGVTWTKSTSAGTTHLQWASVASSASGSNLVAAANGIWTSSEPFTLPEDFNGLADSSQGFQYLGSGIWQPLTPSPGDNGQGLTNLDASGLTSGTVPLAQLPAAVVTNNEIGVTLSGTFSGNVATLSSGQTFTGSNTFQVVDSYGGVRITDGSTNSNVSIQPLASPNSGFQAINFNGYYDNGEHQYNSSKARWRIFVDQRGPGDSFNIDEYYSGALNIFMNIQTNGNMGIGTNAPVYPLEMASGAYVSAAGVWTSVSDRNVKEDFTTIQPEDVLDRLVAMPITQWRYKVEPDGTKHIGPMAQDFYAAFGLGQNNKAIGSIDEDGVALAAIQGLNQKLHSVKTQNAALKQQSDSLAEQLDELKAEVKALKQRQ